MEFVHKPVLLEEVIDGLAIKPDGIYADGTLGGAGHGSRICEKLNAQGRYIGLDQDADAVRTSSERLSRFGGKALVIRSNYADMPQVLKESGIESFL